MTTTRSGFTGTSTVRSQWSSMVTVSAVAEGVVVVSDDDACVSVVSVISVVSVVSESPDPHAARSREETNATATAVRAR
jgi:hypothetical protein